ncbi:RagB/SusD family nutrient uptake outer membrane protein [Flavobacterium dankookense]|uniref:Putative outer membrane starch-binding protein n=1 Tax=Flavobacterium dankookense TaxID=706186 RepID=A0A4R6QC15_9FLAO|nr:RagB/SusD family nutrient uptake outer membrane protein [Flavobacterium dankookense]TDP59393.1 putative outer membrane starch-binding protein [Flavobacterium dankookense]
MKNIKYFKAIALVVFSSILFSSCEEDLNVEPNDTINEIDFLNNPDNAIKLVNGVYNKQLDFEMYSFSWIGMTSITSDDADKGSSVSDTGADKNKMDNLTFEANDISFREVWQGRYDGIGRANNALFYLEQLQIDQTLKNRLIGEVKFLRALFYFDLVRCFGGVPLVTSKIDINDSELINQVVFTRKTKEETYAQIEADLLDAIELLPLKGQYSLNDLGRASKGAAEALLAKAYLYQNKWQQAFDMSGNVIGSGQYGLLTNYQDVWREVGENKLESIYEIQSSSGNALRSYSYVQAPRGTPDLGWGFNTPSTSLESAYEPNDLRKSATILYSANTLWDGFPASPGWSNPRYNYKSYHSSIQETWNGDREQTGKNLRILKYSDILLIRAEAALNLGNTSEALEKVNLLRVRAGLTELTSITMDQLLHERRLEMAMEHDRWFDLVRTGKAVSAMAAVGKTFIVGKHELFPIPESEIILSGNRLIQNPGGY